MNLMSKPPGPGINPPSPQPGDIKKGYRVTNKDIMEILQGGYPCDIEEYVDADTVDSDPSPQGKHRACQLIHGYGEGEGTAMQLCLVRNGDEYPIGFSSHPDVGAVGVDAVIYDSLLSNGITVRAILLKPGDIIRLTDLNAVGADVRLTVMFVDVFL